MATVNTTRYYIPIFGSIQRKMTQISGDPNSPTKDDVFTYEFNNDDEFFDHFRKLRIKTIGGKLEKGNTLCGVYERRGAEQDRPRPRLMSEKFREKKIQNSKP
jgi:hypothetical protein